MLGRLCEGVVLRAFSDETIVLNLQAGQYHALNLTAARMVEIILEADDLDRAVETLTAEFDAPPDDIRTDLLKLCEQLEQRGLLDMLDEG